MGNPIVLDGRKIADKICADLTKRVNQLRSCGIQPKLITISTGNGVAGELYSRGKQRRCKEIGIEYIHWHKDKITAEDMYVAEAMDCPVIIQLPVITEKEIEMNGLGRFIKDYNDVDGFLNIHNVANLAMGHRTANTPCTATGIVELLKAYNINITGTHIVVLGRSNICGRPLTRMLEHEGATVTLCHSLTPPSIKYNAVNEANIIISATGHPHTLTLDDEENNGLAYWWPKFNPRNKIFIDAGMSRDENGKLCGDIDDDIKAESYAYTPVIGGVGQMTSAMLMSNIVKRYE